MFRAGEILTLTPFTHLQCFTLPLLILILNNILLFDKNLNGTTLVLHLSSFSILLKFPFRVQFNTQSLATGIYYAVGMPSS